MNMQEIHRRLRLGLSLVVAYLAGRLAGSLSAPDYSALFSIGFLAGALGTQAFFWGLDRWRNRSRPEGRSYDR